MKSCRCLLMFLILSLSPALLPHATAETYWEQTSGPEGGNVKVLATDPSGRIWAGTRGIFTSDDGGESWTEVMHDEIIRSIAFGPGGEVYAGSESGYVFFSSDTGETWENIQPATDSRIAALFTQGADTLLAGTDGDGLNRTTDLGESWMRVSSGLRGLGVRSIMKDESTQFVFVSSDSGVFRSSDGGAGWAKLSGGLGPSGSPVNDIAANSRGDFFAGTEGGGVFRSTDNGDTWEDVSNDLYAYVVWSVAVDGDDRIFVGSINGVFLSEDDGETWQWSSSGQAGMFTWSLAISGSDEVFAGTN